MEWNSAQEIFWQGLACSSLPHRDERDYPRSQGFFREMNVNSQGCPVCERTDAVQTPTAQAIDIIRCQVCGPFPIQAELPAAGWHGKQQEDWQQLREGLRAYLRATKAERELVWWKTSRATWIELYTISFKNWRHFARKGQTARAPRPS